MAPIRRIGRPGLIGLAARTAVVAGTATAVSGGMIAHSQKKAQPVNEAAPVDLVAELQKLGELKAQGVLSDAEFETAKARLLT